MGNMERKNTLLISGIDGAVCSAIKTMEFIGRKNDFIDRENLNIKGVYVQKDKRLLIVKFNDNSVVKVSWHEDDEFDVYLGVAYAVTRKVYGSNTAFRKMVDQATQVQNTKEKSNE